MKEACRNRKNPLRGLPGPDAIWCRTAIASPESEAAGPRPPGRLPGLPAPCGRGQTPPAAPELPAPDDGKILQAAAPPLQHPPAAAGLCGHCGGRGPGVYRQRELGHPVPAAASGAVLTCRDTGMGKPLLLFTLGLAVLDAIIKQTALLESFAPGNFLCEPGVRLHFVRRFGRRWLADRLAAALCKGEYP